MTEERQIDYDALLHEAFRNAQRDVLRTVLSKVAKDGLPGDHHFYISFHTGVPGVSIAARLLQKYTDQMTIVLQHRFWDLVVLADRFEVKLTFDSIKERLVVPFAAVSMFFDPSVHYGLQFDETADGQLPPLGEMMGLSGSRGVQRGAGRAQSERKKAQRKAKGETSNDTRHDDASGNSGAVPAKSAPAVPAETAPSAPPTGTSKIGPRLVETANDSAKVVSLDQFRKK